jgi:hypothetical protein
MVKITIVDKLDMKPIAPFKTIEEEIEWWDTHSIFDNLPDGTPATPPDTVWTFHHGKKPKSKTYSVRFDADDQAKLEREAAKRGIGPTTLLRMWARERLQRRPHAQ